MPVVNPTVFVIAGPNGAGKTTFANRFLPANVAGKQFLNADLIAAGLSPFDPESQKVRDGRLVIERMRELVAARESFGFETTLAGRGLATKLRRFRGQGYRVVIHFLALPVAEMAVRRVAQRVAEGGHDVPEADVRRRHREGLLRFVESYASLADAWTTYDASRRPPSVITRSRDGSTAVVDRNLHRLLFPGLDDVDA
ncbi:MAG: AAA family ATPase [Planctomycetota bacterium]